jgi:hypothetical protein
MDLAGTRTADQHDILRTIHELAAMQGPDHCLVDLARGEVEAWEVLVGREPCRLHVIGDRPDLSFGQFGLEELRQDRDSSFKGWRPLFNQVGDCIRHAIHLQTARAMMKIAPLAGS